MDLATAYRRVEKALIENDAAPDVQTFLANVNAELMSVNADLKVDEARELVLVTAPETLPIEEREFGGYDMNVYYNPEKGGLELLAMAEHEPNYDFDMVILLKDKGSDRYFMAADSGCSCPSPFEDVRSVSDLTEVKTAKDAQAFVAANTPYGGYTEASMASMLRAIKEHFKW